jgi:hypothetical protein
MRDVRAIVTERGAGCDGRCGVRHGRMPDENAAANGEVVWSWRRDPGVKLARSITLTTVTRQAAHRGEHEGNRKTIARGKPGCLGCTCQIRVHSFATFSTRRCGRSRRPAFPAPSAVQRANEIAKLGRKPAARMRMHVRFCNGVIARLVRAIQYSRDVYDRPERPRRTGSPACAGDDKCGARPSLSTGNDRSCTDLPA